MAKKVNIILSVLLLFICIQTSFAFTHKNYCGNICKLGQCARIKVHVHEQEKVHIQIKGVIEIDKDFRIYKRQGSR